ncbi:MAG: excinuclease ABC subunit UvrC [Lachnospiraceae bacterium]|nr:excinuclease ABC subunit UvrC [Lachnospiraceae bacterium]
MEELEFNIEEELKKLPDLPGVYLMHGDLDEVIYVGKAVVLKNRVRQYFQSGRGKTTKILQMVDHIRRFEYIVTDSEAEALVLESNLIKEYQPKYNTLLKDSKGYPYLYVTVGEEYPRVLYAHQMKKDKNKYFGPYTSGTAVKETLDLLQKTLKLRTCHKMITADLIPVGRPCLNYQMKLCDAPCQGFISCEEYQKKIQEAVALLNGNDSIITKMLNRKMEEAAERLDYEEAMQYRDLIGSVRFVATRQKLSDRNYDDMDVVGLHVQEGDAVVCVMFFREGKIIGREHFHMQAAEGDEPADILEGFLNQYYAGTPYVPARILLPSAVAETKMLTDALTARRGAKVELSVPERGEKLRLVRLAAENAKVFLTKDGEKLKKEEEKTEGAMRKLSALLGMEGLSRVEAFDISNTGGFNSVASMVVFEDGRPRKPDYRKFRIKWVQGMNDYACMEEVLTRRFRRAQAQEDERKGFERLPDLLLMDGGKGQVHIAEKVLESLGLSGKIPVCGMVKDDRHRTRGLYYHDELVDIDQHGPVFRLITRIQDETHRFAIEYHRSLRQKAQTHSILDDIPGIGPKRRVALMTYFESPEEIRKANVDTLRTVPGMDVKSAQAVWSFFHKDA